MKIPLIEIKEALLGFLFGCYIIDSIRIGTPQDWMTMVILGLIIYIDIKEYEQRKLK